MTTEDGLGLPSVDVDAFSTSTACWDLHVQNPISVGLVNISCQFYQWERYTLTGNSYTFCRVLLLSLVACRVLCAKAVIATDLDWGILITGPSNEPVGLLFCWLSPVVVCNAAGGRVGRPKGASTVGASAAGRLGGRHCTASQSSYVSLGWHLLIINMLWWIMIISSSSSTVAPYGLRGCKAPWFVCWFQRHIKCLFVYITSFLTFFFYYSFLLTYLLPYSFTSLLIYLLLPEYWMSYEVTKPSFSF